MRHCRQCRADAVGLLGDDRGHEFTLAEIPDEIAYDASKRQAYHQLVARERGDHLVAKNEAIRTVMSVEYGGSLLIAVATKGGGRINEHFGHAKEFHVYTVSQRGIKLTGRRRVEQYCLGGWGEVATLDHIVVALEGIDILLCVKIGDYPRKQLTQAGLRATEAYGHDYIESALGALYAAEFGIEPPVKTATA